MLYITFAMVKTLQKPLNFMSPCPRQRPYQKKFSCFLASVCCG